MVLKKIGRLFLAVFLVTAVACTANATILEYSNSFNLNGSNATISFTIDTDQGTNSDPSMHNGLDAVDVVSGLNAYDSWFTISLEIDGTTYSDDVFSWTSAYPSVTVNTSDWSINSIDYWVSSGTNVFVIESTNTGTALNAVAYSELDLDNDGVIEINEIDGDNDGDIDAAIANIIQTNSWANATIDSGEWTTSQIPEPATFSLFGLGLFGWAWVMRRRSSK